MATAAIYGALALALWAALAALVFGVGGEPLHTRQILGTAFTAIALAYLVSLRQTLRRIAVNTRPSAAPGRNGERRQRRSATPAGAGEPDPDTPTRRDNWVMLVWFVGFWVTLVYCAVVWVRGPCVPRPSLLCLWDSMVAAVAAIVWPVYWPIQVAAWLL